MALDDPAELDLQASGQVKSIFLLQQITAQTPDDRVR
jgi:hypothetical protein